MKKLLNKFILWIYSISKKYCIKNNVFDTDKLSVKIPNKDIHIIKIEHSEPVFDNDLSYKKIYNRLQIIKQIEDKVLDYIEYKDNNEDIDNNFLLTTTGKLTIIKSNN